jgi:ADP-ribose pyrophosphatase YjhB (NUDIX family)
MPTLWKLPGETVMPNEDINAAARRVSKLWFGNELPSRVHDVLTFPDTGDKRWYLLFVYEAQVNELADIDAPDDTEEVRFVEPGKAPGPWGLDHGSVFARLGR